MLEALDLLSLLATPWGITLLLAAATGIAAWLTAAGAGVGWLARRALGWPAEPSLRQQLDTALDERDALAHRAAAVPEPEQRARHLAAAWRLSDNTATEAAGWELDAVLDGTLSVRAVAGRDVPCTARTCVICGADNEPEAEHGPGAEPDDADPQTVALRAVSTGRCPKCQGDMETCTCGSEKPGLPRTARSAV